MGNTYKLMNNTTFSGEVKNSSLFFDKFSFLRFNQKVGKFFYTDKDKKEKGELIDDILKGLKIQTENVKNYIRRRILLTKKLNAKHIVFKNTSELAIGLGRASVLENGVTLSRNYGFPIIPASSIKGVVRSYAEMSGKDSQKIKEYFGGENSDNPHSGKVIFFDAFICSGVEVYKKDIINNHFSPYYRGKENGEFPLPIDWYEPVPVFFPSISKENTFLFTIAVKNAEEDEANEILEDIEKWLTDALKENGIGGKTSVGYGRFERANDDCFKDELKKIEEDEEKKKMDSLPPFEKKLYEIEHTAKKEEKEHLLSNLFNEFDSFSDDEKIRVAKFFEKSWKELGKWNGKLSKKQEKKVKKIKEFLANHAGGDE